jgi:phosphatidylserine/phosphatidylglycerophosphate/cardiolipin synthase-like enzyme
MRRTVLWIVLACLIFACAPAPGSMPPPRLAGASASEPVQLWQDGAIFKLLARMIEAATRRVFVEVYEIGRADMVEHIAGARARGLDVRVITDPTVTASRNTFASLDQAGVPELFYPVDDAAHQIDHVKLLVVDSEAAVGGMNWGAHSDRNHDYALETRVPAEVDRLVRIFEQDWALARGVPAPLAPLVSEVAQTAPGHEIRVMLRRALEQAHDRALAEVYTFTDPDVITALVNARRRGVDVRVLLDPGQPYNRSTFELLRDAGVEVRWYPVPPGALLHAKIGLVDGELILGSANWTYSGLDVNHELDIETHDVGAISTYRNRFERDWARSPAG